MLKNLSFLMVAGLLVTGCGGDDKKTTTTTVASSSSSSVAKSSAPSSSSSVVSSASVASSSSAAASSVATGNKVLKIDILDNNSTEDWHLQMSQHVKGITKGKTYKFSFKAKATSEKDVKFQISGLEDSSWRSYPSSDKIVVKVTTKWQTFEHIFTADVDDSTMDYQANLSKIGDYTLYLDDISFTEVDGSNQQFTGGTIVQVEDWKFAKNGGTGSMTASVVTE